ncbi:hypothetical protein GTY87_05000 [Streptomyces sp. SID7813]|uniref:Uncharacterized protein n=1 Tax=Streptomyces coelicolor (strain ATCC BAA-471 / A3(2) / M145) TaxID=100226 RepID=Q9EX34_STRCO|nr:hypothetical protein [Streptomyces sp. SID7813]QFI41243.1 hypothetical protein FQ762_05040 [Streptomyces coelicolor A3(2)]TYP10427.1 hypothetical protein FHV91_106388 [Streptomyces coelicolor]TYP14509.1 hypothetical protein FHV98_106388 [Streptomyces coelicolor A3(2)]TYP33958.1 hypothetical protein FHV94_106388 [Streptomyces coelicolor]
MPPVDVRPVALTDVAMLLAHAAVSRPGTGGGASMSFVKAPLSGLG